MSEQKSPLVDDLIHWANEHVEKSDGRLGLLPYEPEHYAGQDGVSVEGDPQPAAVVDSIAAVAQPQYAEIIKQLQHQEDENKEVSRVGELLEAGNNVILVTNHSDLIDIAVTHAAFYSQLHRLGYEAKTGIVISKMVAFLAYRLGNNLAPAVDVLKILENETFLSVPRTDSAKRRGVGRLLPSDVDRHNKHMRERVANRLGKGALLLAVAASGTIDKPNPINRRQIDMSSVSNGTKRMMMGSDGDNFLLPVGVLYGQGQPLLRIADIPRAIKSEEVIDRGMKSIAQALSEHVTDQYFEYKFTKTD